MARKRRCTKADRERQTRRTSHSSFVLRGYEEKKKKKQQRMHARFILSRYDRTESAAYVTGTKTPVNVMP